MPYEKQNGEFTIAKNERKTDSKHPDYTGQGTSLDGTPVWVDAWIRKSKDGRSFLSARMKPKTDSSKPASKVVPLNDTIGF
jgi:uncharacterized protein (DUF736 family)